MQNILQLLAYICEFIFIIFLLIFIISCLIRLLGAKAGYNADEDDKRIEFVCLTAMKKYVFGRQNVYLGQGTYVIGTSVFSELRIAKTKTRFSGILEVLDSGECHLYINSGTIIINNEKYGQLSKGYVCMYPGDVFTIGEQTCMINILSFDDDEDEDENTDTGGTDKTESKK